MSKLKKIEAQINALKKVAENTLKLLNEVTEGGYLDDSQVEDKVHFLPQMIRSLYHLKQTFDENAAFEGLSDEEAAEKKATEKAEAIKKLQVAAAAALDKLEAERNPKKVEPIEEAEPVEEDDSIVE